VTGPSLALRSVEAFYGRAQVLFGIDLAVHPGEVVALLGRNGAGKSTLLKTIVGIMPRTTGEVEFDGKSLRGLPSYHIGRLGIAYVPEDRRIFGNLTVLENLEAGRQAPRDGYPHWTPERLFTLFPNLAERRNNLGSRLSGGEQQMLAAARALMGNPRLLLLDEPSEGIAPIIVDQIVEAMRQLKADGLPILLAEQNLGLALEVADRAYIIEKGSLRYEGSVADLTRDQASAELHLAV
jgi:branched-chain amino acid transport system ATP-binding protein